MNKVESQSQPRKEPMYGAKTRGFSLIELLIAIAIGMIMTAVTVISFQSQNQQAAVTSGYNTALQTMRRARDEAVAERRVWAVSFSTAATPNTITLSKNGPLPGGTLVSTYVLPTNVGFAVTAGLPSPGPDGFGTGTTPVDFDQPGGGGKTILFQPDGSAQDAAGNINNGVVYIAQPGMKQSTRAISLWGTTGRLRGWQLTNGNVWSER